MMHSTAGQLVTTFDSCLGQTLHDGRALAKASSSVSCHSHTEHHMQVMCNNVLSNVKDTNMLLWTGTADGQVGTQGRRIVMLPTKGSGLH